jgi:hypothetical protein
MIALLLALSCAPASDRFAGDGALRRTLASIDRDGNGTVETTELPDPGPDRDGNGALTPDELRAALDVDPWTVHEAELEPPFAGPKARPTRSLARDVDHAPQVVVRDVLRFLARELAGDGRTVPTEALVFDAAATGRLDSVPAKDALGILREAARANGTPLPDPPTPPRCCEDRAP